MQKNTDITTKEQQRKAARKTSFNTIAWHGLSAIAMLFLLFMFRASVVFSILLGVAALIEIGLVALAVVSLKNRLQEIEEQTSE